jgi:predicted acyltransferase
MIEVRAPKTRLRALDFVRGGTVIGMILVNNPGSKTAAPFALEHAGWYGIRFADVIGPAFLWTMGFAMALSFARRRADVATQSATLRHVLRRTIVLFLIGVGLHLMGPLFPELDWAGLADVDLMGILQRIALAYALGAVLLLYVPRPALTAVGLLIVYALVMVAGAATPDVAFAPGTNLANRIDARLFGPYASEGHSLLTIVPTAATVLFGAATARAWMATGTAPFAGRIALLYGIVPIAAAMLASRVIPITRYLWSPSYALWTAGLTALVFLVVHLAMRRTAAEPALDPISAVGANPLLLFVVSEVVRMLLESVGAAGPDGAWRSVWQAAYEALAARLPQTAASLVMSVAFLVPMLVLAVLLARRKIYVRL